MARLLLSGALLALVSGPAVAQFGVPADPCPLGTAEARLRGAVVEAALFTNGNLFFGNQTTNGDGYLVPLGQTGPNGGPVSPLYMANLWIGGIVEGEVRTAATRYSGFQFRPGLTGSDGVPPSPSGCAAADRIWVVSRDDVLAYLDGAPPTADLAEWPVALGAPVLDGDGVPGNYDLEAGDQPAVHGDVTAFWAMTDAASGASYYRLPLGVDVTVEAYAVRQAQLGAHTFYRLTVTNRNAVAIEGAYVGLFLDADLGNASDDYVGTDTTAQMLYFYNALEDDRVYGVPPAFGAVLAEGPVGLPNGLDDDGDGDTDETGERLRITHIPAIWKVDPTGSPGTVSEIYNRLQGLFNDGTPIRARGDGYGSQAGAPITRFTMFGDPVTGVGWSEENNDGNGTHDGMGQRWGMIPVGPFRLLPDSSATVTFALVFAQGADRHDSIRRLRYEARGVRAAVLGGDLDPARVVGREPPPTPLVLRLPSPNPFRGSTALRLDGPDGIQARVTVYDALGRRVAETEVAAGSSVDLGAGLTPGVYVVRVAGFGFDEALTVTKLP